MRHFTRTVIVLAWLSACLVAGAQQQPLFDRIGMTEGLPGKEVLALFQDRQGLVWIGTNNGLARHEGPRIRTWHHDRKDPNSLSNEQVNCISQSADGWLWVATANGISAMGPQGAGFVRYTLPASDVDITRANRVLDVLPDVGDRLWASTELGLFSLDPASGVIERMHIDDAPWQADEGIVVIKHSLLRDEVRAGIWLGTTRGLLFHHVPSGAWYHAGNDPLGWGCFTTASASVPTLLRDGSLLWFDVDHYALMHADLRGGLRTVDHLNGERMHFTPRFLAQDIDGSIWLSTWTYRLYLMSEDLGTATRINDTDGLPGAMVKGGPYNTLLDRWGTRWFGTRDGVALLAPWRQQLQVLRPQPGVTLQGVLAQAGDTLLLGTLGHGLLLHHPPSDHQQLLVPQGAYPGVDPDRWKLHVKCAVHWEGARYLVGTARGLLLLDLHRKRLETVPADMGFPAKLGATSITRLVRDTSGRVWVGTWSRGLYRLEADGAVKHFHSRATDPAFRLPMNGVLDILPGTNGDLWVGLNDGGGLVRLPSGEGPAVAHFQAQGPDALYAVVTCLAEGPDGAIWAGTHQGGVDRLDPTSGVINTFTRVDGLPSDRIGRLCFDAHGDLWAITSAGPARLPQGADRFVPFEPPKGIAPSDFLSGLSLLPNDRLAMVNRDQLLLIGTSREPARRPAPEVLVVKATHPGGELLLPGSDTQLRLPFDRRALSMEVAALGDASASQVRFAYMVEGVTEDFTQMGTSGRLELIDLPRGQHRILIGASIDGRQWSAEPASLTVEVLPPFWAAWWFRGLLLLLIAGIAWIMVRSYVRDKLEAQRVAFEREQALLAERVRIASDMHDDLGGGLTALKLRSEMALRTETDPGKRRHLEQLAASAGELIDSMRQIIWTMDGDQHGVADLVAYCTNHARLYLHAHGIACVVEAPGPWPELTLTSEQRRNIFLVIKEALHNVVKHANASQVRLSMKAGPRGLDLSITDDGVGLNGHQQPGNGLRNMHRRMEQLGGHILIGPAPDAAQGTRVHVDLNWK